MPITYGLTEQGFVAKPLDVIKGELEAAFKAGPLGQSAGTEPDGSIPAQSVAGQLVAIMADGLAAQWEIDQAIVAGVDPTTASGAAQDAVCSITGTVRAPASKSTVSCVCSGTPGTGLPAGRVATVVDSGARFVSSAAGTIALLSSWGPSTAYAYGAMVTNGGNVYFCGTAGTSSGSGSGPTSTATTPITDGGVTWYYVGPGMGAVLVPFAAEQTGPIGAVAGTLSQIATPVDGWRGVRNPLDAVVGAALEGAAALRVKREVELTSDALAAANAIRAHMIKVTAVKACTVFVNNTDATDANGLPPHSVEVLVLGGADADVAQAVWEAVGGGIATCSSSSNSAVITDSSGNPQTVYWTRPTAVPIYIDATVLYDASAYPSDGDAQIKNALVTFGASYVIGKDVRASALIAACFDGPTSTADTATPVPGVLDVSPLYLGTSPGPGSSSPVLIGLRQIATFDTSRITVTSSPGTP